MDRIHDILNNIASQKTFDGKKRSELKDSDFLFPETRSFPITTPADVKDAISNYGRMSGKMSYDVFLRKLYNMCKRKGPEFVAALPEKSKDKLGIKSESYDNDNRLIMQPDPQYTDMADDTDNIDEPSDLEEIKDYKSEYLEMAINSLKNILSNVSGILDHSDMDRVKENLTEPWLQGMIAVVEDNMSTIHDFVKFSDSPDDNSTEGATNSRPGLWENIRKKKERMGKKYKPAKPGDKDRPDPETWKKLQNLNKKD